MIEYRFIADAELRSDGLFVTGYAARFNSRSFPITDRDGSTFIEQLMPSTFDRVLASPTTLQTKALVDHNDQQYLGSVGDNLNLWTDDAGLAFKLVLPDTELGRAIPRMISSSEITGMSFSFSGPTDTWQPDPESRGLLRSIYSIDRLLDISAVHRPAYGLTSLGFSSTPTKRFLELEQALDRVRYLEKSLAPPLRKGKK
jgi:HK97 family phage prohead protease